MKTTTQILLFYLVFIFGLDSISAQGTFENGPYKHVTPQDVETAISVGVIGPIPTEEYTGGTTITEPTTIENKIINACLRIDADNVTIRNSIINCNGLYPIQVKNGSSNFKIEYSRVTCGSSSKVFFFPNGAPNATIANNEVIGCQDFFFIEGDLEGMVVKNNYMHTLIGNSSSHADGFQIGEFSLTTGNIHIQGNYFDPDNPEVGKTDLIFGTNFSEVDLLIEDNYIEPWGYYTIRCGGAATTCTVKNNVFSQAFAGVVQYILLGGSERITFSCNRYADGEFVEKFIEGKDLLTGVEHIIENCPEFNGVLTNGEVTEEGQNIRIFQDSERGMLLNLNLLNAEEIKVVVYDILGKQILKKELGIVPSGESSIHFPMDNYNTGVYIFNISLGTKLISQKVIFERK